MGGVDEALRVMESPQQVDDREADAAQRTPAKRCDERGGDDAHGEKVVIAHQPHPFHGCGILRSSTGRKGVLYLTSVGRWGGGFHAFSISFTVAAVHAS